MNTTVNKIKYFIVMTLAPVFLRSVGKIAPHQAKPSTSVYDITLKDLDGNDIKMASFKGKKILVVNVASACGFTPQYENLEKLHRTYGKKIVVIGVPSNEFGGQEPEDNTEIKKFCKTNYDVTFVMCQKTIVKGTNMHPLYQWLTDKNQNGWNTQKPEWNFCKYLISENGELMAFYKSHIDPLSSNILKHLN